MSDHYLISFCLNSQKPSSTHLKAIKHTVFRYSKTNFAYLYSFLDSCSSSILLCQDINTAWLQLKSDILSARDYAVPTIAVSSHRCPIWFNCNLKQLLNKIHTLCNRIKSKPSPSSWLLTKLSQFESTFQTQIQLSKNKYIYSLIDQFSSSPGKPYRHLKSLRCSSNFIPRYVSFKSFNASNPNSVVQLFNNYFISVFTNSDFVLPSLDKLSTPSNQLNHIKITSDDVFENLMSLNISKAGGCDDISPHFLKLCMCYISTDTYH